MCVCVSVYFSTDCHALQVSCASEGEVSITVGQTEVLCQSARQEVSAIVVYGGACLMSV